ncbi:hypothetical protein AWENTII_006585 [Aspergillus wentii]
MQSAPSSANLPLRAPPKAPRFILFSPLSSLPFSTFSFPPSQILLSGIPRFLRRPVHCFLTTQTQTTSDEKNYLIINKQTIIQFRIRIQKKEEKEEGKREKREKNNNQRRE